MNAAETLLMCHLTKSCGEHQFAAIGKGHATGGTGQQLDPEVGLQASQLLAE